MTKTLTSFRAHCFDCNAKITLCTEKKVTKGQNLGISHSDLPESKCESKMDLKVARIAGIVVEAKSPIVENYIKDDASIRDEK